MTPMCRVNVNPHATSCFYPTAKNATAWKHERVRSIVVKDRQFEVAIKRRGGYRFPLAVLQ